MVNSDLVSIVVPVYNVDKYLIRCANSILNQTYSNIEVILVDDGSTDNSASICDRIAQKDSRVKVIHKKNGGLSSARNAGIDVANGKYIGFVDSDDYIDSNMYSDLLNAIIEYDCDISVTGIVREKDESDATIIRNPKTQKIYSDKEAITEILCSRDIGISVWSKLYKREIFDGVRFPVNETNEDAAVLLQTVLGKKVIHIGKPHYHYIVREGSISFNYKASNVQAFYKHSQYIYNELTDIYPDLNDIALWYFLNVLVDFMWLYTCDNTINDDNACLYYAFIRSNFSIILKKGSFTIKVKAVIMYICSILQIRLKVHKNDGE